MGARGATPILVGALALVLGIALGHALGGRPATERAAPATAPLEHAPSSPDELAGALRELARTLEALRRTLELRPTERTAAPSAEPASRAREVAFDPAASGELVDVLRGIAASLRELRGRAPGDERARRTEELVIPAFVDRESAFAATGLLRSARASANPDESVEAAFRRKHLFHTSQAILDAYGAPDDIQTEDNDSEQWSYVLQRGETTETFVFSLKDGSVRNAWYEHEP